MRSTSWLQIPVVATVASVLATCLLLFGVTAPIAAQEIQRAPSLSLQLVTNGLTSPVAVTNAGDGTGRIFIVQQTGQNAVLSSICSGDLTTGLADALEVFSAACDEFPPID